jgi:hypothetical protein
MHSPIIKIKHTTYLMGDTTIHIYTSKCIVAELSGRGNLCDKERKILHSAFINKPSDRIHNEMS